MRYKYDISPLATCVHEPGPVSQRDIQKTTKYVEKNFVGNALDRNLGGGSERVSEYQRRDFAKDVPLLELWLGEALG